MTTSLLTPLPLLVSKCLRHLSQPRALKASGLFRFGNVDQHHFAATQLRVAFDADENPALGNDQECATALLLFLADLPAPIFTDVLAPCFLDALAVPDAGERLVCVASVVKLLPPPNYTLLRALCAYAREWIRSAGAGQLDDLLDALAPLMMWTQDDDALERLGAPLPLEVEDNESLLVIGVQSAVQTAQLVLLGHLWTVQESANYMAASLLRSNVALNWRLELLDGTRLDPDALIGTLDLQAMDTLYLETDDEIVESALAAPARQILRMLILECDSMLGVPAAVPTAAAVPSGPTRTGSGSNVYGYVPRQAPAGASTKVADDVPEIEFDAAEFDAILDRVLDAAAADDDDEDGNGNNGAVAEPVAATPYGAIPARQPLLSAEAKKARKNLRATVTKSRMVLKHENLLDDQSRRSRELARRAGPSHYLVAPPTSNAAAPSPLPSSPLRGPPPKKPTLAPPTRKMVAKPPAASPTGPQAPLPPRTAARNPARSPARPQYGVSRLVSGAEVVRATPLPLPSSPGRSAPPMVPRPTPDDAPPPMLPRPVPVARAVPSATAAAADDRRATLGAPVRAAPMVPVAEERRATLGAMTKPLPAPPAARQPLRPTGPPPQPRTPPAPVLYSNIPQAAGASSAYSNLPHHTLLIQRTNMGLASADDGLEIEVFDDALLGQLQQ